MAEPEHHLDAVENLLGYAFGDRSLLFQALRHRSYANEMGMPPIESNERLEFLGDSVVELAVSHLLYEDFPDAAEGKLTKIRSPIVKGEALASAARRLGLDEHVLLGRGEEQTGGREKRSILADTFEAVVGALYLDAGFDVARGFILASLEDTIGQVLSRGTGDFKSDLQEQSAKRTGYVPRYHVREEGPDHFKTFHATVEVSGKRYGPVTGNSKKEAEQAAARLALEKLRWKRRGRSA